MTCFTSRLVILENHNLIAAERYVFLAGCMQPPEYLLVSNLVVSKHFSTTYNRFTQPTLNLGGKNHSSTGTGSSNSPIRVVR